MENYSSTAVGCLRTSVGLIQCAYVFEWRGQGICEEGCVRFACDLLTSCSDASACLWVSFRIFASKFSWKYHMAIVFGYTSLHVCMCVCFTYDFLMVRWLWENPHIFVGTQSFSPPILRIYLLLHDMGWVKNWSVLFRWLTVSFRTLVYYYIQ